MAQEGRPTDYNDTIVSKSEEYLASAKAENMDIPTVEGLALYLDVSRKTLYNWRDLHPEFLHTLEKLEIMQKQELVKIGIFGGKEINANIVSLMLKANHGMVETVRNELGGVINENGEREPIRLFVNAGQGFLPANITLPATPITSSTAGQSSVQSTDLASEGKKDIHGNNGVS